MALAASGTLLLAAAIAGLVWAKRYAPLSSTAGGVSAADQLQHLGAYVEAEPGSGGRDVVYPRFRAGHDYWVGFTLRNHGPLDVTVLGLVVPDLPGAATVPQDLRAAPHPAVDEAFGGQNMLEETVPVSRLRIRSHGARFVWVGFRMQTCYHHDRGGTESHTDVAFRIRYLGIFARSQRVELPTVVSIRCGRQFPPRTTHPASAAPSTRIE